MAGVCRLQGGFDGEKLWLVITILPKHVAGMLVASRGHSARLPTGTSCWMQENAESTTALLRLWGYRKSGSTARDIGFGAMVEKLSSWLADSICSMFHNIRWWLPLPLFAPIQFMECSAVQWPG